MHEYAAPPEFKKFGTDQRGNYLAAIRWVDDAVERVREKLDAVGVLAIASWSDFLTDGVRSARPRSGHIALGISLVTGISFLSFLVMGLLVAVMPRDAAWESSSYRLERSGRVVQVKLGPVREGWTFADLDGRVLGVYAPDMEQLAKLSSVGRHSPSSGMTNTRRSANPLACLYQQGVSKCINHYIQ